MGIPEFLDIPKFLPFAWESFFIQLDSLFSFLFPLKIALQSTEYGIDD